MPPKKGEAAPIVTEDNNPYGAFVNVEVPGCTLPIDSSKADGGEETPAPSIYLSVTYPGPFPPLAGEPVQGDAATGQFNLSFSKSFRQDPSLDSLHDLLNRPPVLTLHDAASNTPLAKATLDLTAFGLGDARIVVSNLVMEVTYSADAADAAAKPTTPPSGKKPAKGAAPEPTAVAFPRIIGPAVIPTLTVHLTHRSAPAADASAAPSDASPATASKAPSMPGTPETGLEVDTQSLPAAEPYSFLPVEQHGKANVVSVHFNGPDALPAGLVAASDVAAGKLSLSAALCLPPGAGAPLVLAGAGIVKGASGDIPPSVTWPAGGCIKRVVLGEELDALMEALDGAEPGEAVLGVEVCRVVAEDKAVGDTAAAWEAHHAWVPLPGAACLLEAGQAGLPGPGPVNTGWEAAPMVAWPAAHTSGLPGFVPPAGKVKPLEEVAVGAPSAWAAAGSCLMFRLTFARPPVAPWTAPDPVQPSLQALVPQRELHPPAPPATPQQDVSSQMSRLIKEMAAAYQQHYRTIHAAASQGAPQVVHKALIKQLNTSGRYLEWRDRLKQPLLRLVREQMGKSGAMDPREMTADYASLYEQLLDSSHQQLYTAADAQPKPEPHPPRAPNTDESSSLLALALESEAVDGDWRRAGSLMAKRRLDADNPQVHLQAAQLMCRSHVACGAGALQEAATAFNAALEIEPSNALALACTSLTHMAIAAQLPQQTAPTLESDLARHTQLALAAAQALRECSNESTMSWVLLYLAFKSAGRESEASACTYELKRRQRSEQAANMATGAALSQSAASSAASPALDDAVTAGDEQADEAEPSAAPAPELTKSFDTAEGLLQAWELAVQLGVAHLACEIQSLANTTLRRCAAGLPARCHLLNCKTHLLSAKVAAALEAHSESREVVADPGTADGMDAAVPTEEQPEPASSAPLAPPKLTVWQHLDAATKAARRAKASLAAAESTSHVLERWEPLMLMGDIEWERASCSALLSDDQQAAREHLLAARSEARRWYQEVLQQGVAQGWGGVADGQPAADADTRSALRLQLQRSLLRLTASYLQDARLPDCALNVATVAVQLWPHSSSCWQAAARAADSGPSAAQQAEAAWAQANLCDTQDGRAWEALALIAFRADRYEDGVAGLDKALGLHAWVHKDPEHCTAVPPADPVALLQEAAQCACTRGQYTEALRHLDAALLLEGGMRFQVQYQLSQARAALGDLVSARAAAGAAGGLVATPFDHQQLQHLLQQLAAA